MFKKFLTKIFTSHFSFRNYKSIGEFFTRSLREDARYIDPLSCIVSPCDGRVLHFGNASNANIEQVKGVSYSLEAFLGPQWQSLEHKAYVESIKLKPESMLYQCIIYLAPGDYHRFHSPTTWKPEIRRHFHGELLSVSPKIAKWVPGLFALNERAVYIGNWQHGFFSFTAVGELSIKIRNEIWAVHWAIIWNKKCDSSYYFVWDCELVIRYQYYTIKIYSNKSYDASYRRSVFVKKN